MSTSNLASVDAGPLAQDVMLLGPKTFPPTTTVAEARAIFESPRQKLLVVCDGSRYVGAVTRGALEGADDGATVETVIDPDVATMAPEDPKDRVREICERSGLNRIPVVDVGGDLLGLVCFNPGNDSYCVA